MSALFPVSFQRLAWANLLAQSAEQLSLAAVPIVAVLLLQAGPGEIGLLASIQSLPFLLLSMPLGLLADRSSRTRLMALAEGLRALALLLLLALILTGHASIGALAATDATQYVRRAKPSSYDNFKRLRQLTTGAIPRISIHAEGAAAELNIKPIVAAVLAGFLRVQSDTVNMVNAPFLAKERGIEVREVKTEKEGDYHTLIRVSVKTEAGERSVAGTLFSNAEPRLIELFGIKVEAELAGHMMYIVNEDAPGFIGRIGTLLGEAGINIGTFNLGRRAAGGEAVLLLSVDSPVPASVIAAARDVPGVKRVMALAF